MTAQQSPTLQFRAMCVVKDAEQNERTTGMCRITLFPDRIGVHKEGGDDVVWMEADFQRFADCVAAGHYPPDLEYKHQDGAVLRLERNTIRGLDSVQYAHLLQLTESNGSTATFYSVECA